MGDKVREAALREQFDAWVRAAPAFAPEFEQHRAWAETFAWFAVRDLAAPPQEQAPGWVLVPIEPTREMWAAVNKLDDEMAAGSYDGKGCSIEQAWQCLLDHAPAAPSQEQAKGRV